MPLRKLINEHVKRNAFKPLHFVTFETLGKLLIIPKSIHILLWVAYRCQGHAPRDKLSQPISSASLLFHLFHPADKEKLMPASRHHVKKDGNFYAVWTMTALSASCLDQ